MNLRIGHRWRKRLLTLPERDARFSASLPTARSCVRAARSGRFERSGPLCLAWCCRMRVMGNRQFGRLRTGSSKVGRPSRWSNVPGVKRYDPGQRFGFIALDDGENDVFVHATTLTAAAYWRSKSGSR